MISTGGKYIMAKATLARRERSSAVAMIRLMLRRLGPSR